MADATPAPPPWCAPLSAAQQACDVDAAALCPTSRRAYACGKRSLSGLSDSVAACLPVAAPCGVEAYCCD